MYDIRLFLHPYRTSEDAFVSVKLLFTYIDKFDIGLKNPQIQW